jgi:hypothetical protein
MRACAHQPEVKTMLLKGHWPHACDPDLSKHIHTCPRCRQQVLLATAFQGDRARTMQAAPIQHPGLVWWRAQLRRREQALRQVGRSTSTANLFALILTIAAAVTLLLQQIQAGTGWPSWLSEPYGALHSGTASILASAKDGVATDPNLLMLATGVGVLLLLGAVVVYFASDRT